MKDLLESDGEYDNSNDNNVLTINHDFKRKYDEKKRKEALSKAKELLKSAESDNEISTESSSSEDEDSEAELLDFKTQNKILDTLSMIKKKDPTIYDSSHVIFSESDDNIDLKDSEEEKKKERPLTYKDYERKLLLGNLQKDDGTQKNKSNRIVYDKEQEDLKRAFLEASKDLEGSDDDSETLVEKIKTKEELEREENTFKSFLSKNIENGMDPMESLNRYWGPEEDLDENERFLRNYILNQEWKETKGHSKINDETPYSIRLGLDEIDEEEDEKHLEMSNEFESIYNFRYEEPNVGQQIQSYSRNISSLRRPDDRRKIKRKEKKERKAEGKLRLQEELKMLKSWKKKELMEKLKRIQEVSGNNRITDEQIDLESEFDSKKHDECMEKLFDDHYDKEKEPLSLSEILEDEEEKIDNNGCFKIQKINMESDEKNNNFLHDFEWWQCDGCFKEIMPKKKKFDCTICENYTLCKLCCHNINHEHPLKKSRVPERLDGNENKINLNYGNDEKINSLLDEYYGLDFEDVLDNGKLFVRFKYTKVEKNDYGLKTEDILTMDDKQLNKHISLKKLAPYRLEKKKKYTYSSGKNNKKKESRSLNKKNKIIHSNSAISFPINEHINKNRLQAYY